jgi:hypothetical protein
MAHPQQHMPLVGEFEGVAQQVDEDLAHPLLVGAHHRWQRPLNLQVEKPGPWPAPRAQTAWQCRGSARQTASVWVERQPTGFDVGDVERALNQRATGAPTAFDHVDRLLAVRRNRAVLAHQLGVTQNAVERCAQFMADRADVAAFGLVGLVGCRPRLLGDLLRACCSAASV